MRCFFLPKFGKRAGSESGMGGESFTAYSGTNSGFEFTRTSSFDVRLFQGDRKSCNNLFWSRCRDRLEGSTRRLWFAYQLSWLTWRNTKLLGKITHPFGVYRAAVVVSSLCLTTVNTVVRYVKSQRADLSEMRASAPRTGRLIVASTAAVSKLLAPGALKHPAGFAA